MAISGRLGRLREDAHLSQRALAEASGISQPTLSRIESGAREPHLGEQLALSAALGLTLDQLRGTSPVAERVTCAARATGDATMTTLRDKLVEYLELADYLADQAIPEPT
ncbi:helix-turn-helix protein [Mumia flava]|uniref:Helix-turn-helix protein n=1 Tax=Mumia flava TaxID=1348852 RepID=A0A0B2BKR6_9ACTN|nr:helix-turn-helix transcriptional regulator [Mumia flava]PJJ54026.1 helix-turn-helix protein [Mumia flava]